MIDKIDLEVIWEALHGYREHGIHGEEYDQQWDDICTNMAWITEALEEVANAGGTLGVLLKSTDVDKALMEYDTINGTALLSQWETVQNTFDLEN